MPLEGQSEQTSSAVYLVNVRQLQIPPKKVVAGIGIMNGNVTHHLWSGG